MSGVDVKWTIKRMDSRERDSDSFWWWLDVGVSKQSRKST